MSAEPIIDDNGDLQFALEMLDRTARAGDTRAHALAIRAVSSLAPTVEIGLQRNDYGTQSNKNLNSLMGWYQLDDIHEVVPALKWPQSIKTYDRMRSDSQISALMRAMTYPIRRFKFMIDANGADPDIVQNIANDLNLDVQGAEPRTKGRRKGRFNFDDWVRHALLAMVWGHMYFEKNGEVEDDLLWHLRKLVPRMPHTINQINVDPKGDLISIRQNLQRFSPSGGLIVGVSGYAGPEIPAISLAPMIWEMEGANWLGRSLIHDCYRNWLIKDRLLRVDAINHERAGGVPIAEAPAGATPAEMERLSLLAQNFKVGEGAGGSVPAGTNFNLHKIGSGTDVIASINYHDESMARLMLHMFIQLGQTATGSRALGGAFIEYAFIAQQAVATWLIQEFNQQVMEDWVNWNWGEDKQIPLLTYVIEEQNEHLAVSDLFQLIECRAIVVDQELEDWLRDKYKMPPSDPTTARLLAPTPSSAPTAIAAYAWANRVEWLKGLMLRSYDEIVDDVHQDVANGELDFAQAQAVIAKRYKESTHKLAAEHAI